jgi:hypothetical protein
MERTLLNNSSPSPKLESSLARVVTNTRRAEHIHPVLASLNWLPSKYRIDYKEATLAYKTRSTGSPANPLPSVSDYMPTRQLRSSTLLFLVKPPARTEIARRTFSQTAPAVWNSLPHETRNAERYGRFQSSIRTHYHRLTFKY